MSSSRPAAARDLSSLGMVNTEQALSDSDQEPCQPPRRTRKHSRDSSTEHDYADRYSEDDDDPAFKRQRNGTRQSERSNRHQGNMAEVVAEPEVLEPEFQHSPATKIPKTVEHFAVLPSDNDFAKLHTTMCETCGGNDSERPFVYCQGCNFSYHQTCIGRHPHRQHVVTRVSEEEWILQCKRCVGVAHKRDNMVPDLGKCVNCGEHGQGCLQYTTWTSDGSNDDTSPTINAAGHVMTRCWTCFQAWHPDHLSEFAEDEFGRWRCDDCLEAPGKVTGIIAWRPVDPSSYEDEFDYNMIEEIEKLYLVKWKDRPYSQASWVPGAWLWAIGSTATRKAFAKTEDAQKPRYSLKEAIPASYTEAEAILDVKYADSATAPTFEHLEWALVKYAGLNYEDVAWEPVPASEEADRHSAFAKAHEDYIYGLAMRQPRPVDVNTRLMDVRELDFQDLKCDAQPAIMDGGKLMKYQLDGLNWLYHQWYAQENVILGDEMGLGKTIQIIAFIATLVEKWECSPHLIVVPNSTCENWRREFKRWAPGLRVIAYYGSKYGRQIIHDYELYPEACSDIRCHVMIVSYETATTPDDQAHRLLHNIRWQSLIVDEGQRLKNDSSQLYASLSKVKAPFKVLMTGTPLQNNQRELFNLLQFIDRSARAAKMEERYSELDESKVQELHARLRPHFLRRTKAEVLGFLPPMRQVILPLSMPFQQKEMYRDILASSKALQDLVMSSKQPGKRAGSMSLNNILMQLRKCLCHPSLCEDNGQYDTSQALIQASGKLVLLQLLLPKLQAAGHRVLIFSQFLGMLDIVEDFLTSMSFKYGRLDGSINSLEKQKRLDQYNAPDSDLFAFLLSTRAGGVGINLATADTVIVLDPDFNPHQDVQALSRAHRIGQQKKVLCLQFITKDTVEERILQIGRKKLALDKALIQDINDDVPVQDDLLSMLRHGAAKLITRPDSVGSDIQYDEASIDALLDRSKIEAQPAITDVKNMWSFAQVWNKDGTAHQENIVSYKEQKAPVMLPAPNLKRKGKHLDVEDVQPAGRGRRVRQKIDYFADTMADELGLDVDGAALKQEESDAEFNHSDADVDSADDKKSQRNKIVAARAAKTTVRPAVAKTAKVKASKPVKEPKGRSIKLSGINFINNNRSKLWSSKTSKPNTPVRAKPKPKSVASTSPAAA